MSKRKKHKRVRGGQPPPPAPRPKCPHRQEGEAKLVYIGGRLIWAGGGMHLTKEDVAGFDLLINLRAELLPEGVVFGEERGRTLYLPIHDFMTVAEADESAFLKALRTVRGRMAVDDRVLVFCAGGHGRTGLFLAGLLALMEPFVEDPVAEIRARYCDRAVETPAQEAQVARWHGVARESHSQT